MSKKIEQSSYKNGRKFIIKNGNKRIEGAKERLESLKEVDQVRRSMPTATDEYISVLIST